MTYLYIKGRKTCHIGKNKYFNCGSDYTTMGDTVIQCDTIPEGMKLCKRCEFIHRKYNRGNEKDPFKLVHERNSRGNLVLKSGLILHPGGYRNQPVNHKLTLSYVICRYKTTPLFVLRSNGLRGKMGGGDEYSGTNKYATEEEAIEAAMKAWPRRVKMWKRELEERYHGKLRYNGTKQYCSGLKGTGVLLSTAQYDCKSCTNSCGLKELYKQIKRVEKLNKI